MKAIGAHGGEKNLRKPRKGILKATNKFDGFDVLQEEFFDIPKQWKRVTTGTIDGKRKVSYDLCVDDTVWAWEDGGEVQQTQNKNGAMPYFGHLTLLLDFASADFKLTPLKKREINGRLLNGISVSRIRGAGDYYFDSATGLLVESNYKWVPEPGKEYDTRTTFGEFKDVDGVKLAHRRTTYIKGKDSEDFVLSIDIVVSEVRILEALPNSTFSHPEKK